jgi:hypothetical protein
MPRRPRLLPGGIAFDGLNERVGRLDLFCKPAVDSAFEKFSLKLIIALAYASQLVVRCGMARGHKSPVQKIRSNRSANTLM